ncbi:MAG: hypothetical protein ABW152_01295 [Candidatus Thiodiazotropha endolucinida]
MAYGIDMKRLHQGCGESLQSNLPGIPMIRRRTTDVSEGQHRTADKIRSKNSNPRDESDYR